MEGNGLRAKFATPIRRILWGYTLVQVAPPDLADLLFGTALVADEAKFGSWQFMRSGPRRPWKGALIFSWLVLLASISVMVFVPREQVPLEVAVLIAGLLAGAVLVRFGVSRRWMSSVVLVSFIAVWFALDTAGYAWFGGFLAGASAGVAWGRIFRNRTVNAGHRRRKGGNNNPPGHAACPPAPGNFQCSRLTWLLGRQADSRRRVPYLFASVERSIRRYLPV